MMTDATEGRDLVPAAPPTTRESDEPTDAASRTPARAWEPEIAAALARLAASVPARPSSLQEVEAALARLAASLAVPPPGRESAPAAAVQIATRLEPPQEKPAINRQQGHHETGRADGQDATLPAISSAIRLLEPPIPMPRLPKPAPEREPTRATLPGPPSAPIQPALRERPPQRIPIEPSAGAPRIRVLVPPPAPATGKSPTKPPRASPMEPRAPKSAPPHPLRTHAARAARLIALAAAGWIALMVGLIGVYRFIDPPASALMAYSWLTGTPPRQTWVPVSSISPNLVRAVVLSEDGRFCQHWGVDLKEVADAIERARDGIPRGASTISMQVIKNLFLWQSKSYLRKAIEVPLTFVMEAFWSKRRILEVYLNIAEWGPGIFGAEAAARHHFNKPAARLSEREAALLAVSLPNPIGRDAGDPGPGTARLASNIQMRVRQAERAVECIGITPR